jgi:hypothetical protein
MGCGWHVLSRAITQVAERRSDGEVWPASVVALITCAVSRGQGVMPAPRQHRPPPAFEGIRSATVTSIRAEARSEVPCKK